MWLNKYPQQTTNAFITHDKLVFDKKCTGRAQPEHATAKLDPCEIFLVGDCTVWIATLSLGSKERLEKVIGRKEWKECGIIVEEFREHIEKVSEQRYEIDPAVIREVIEWVQDMSGCEKAIRRSEWLVCWALIEMIQFMFDSRAHKWGERLKNWEMCLLFKKGYRKVKGNYRGFILLAMDSGMVETDKMVGWAHQLDGWEPVGF